MAEVGSLDWAVNLKEAAESKKEVQEMASEFEETADVARDADEAIGQMDETTGSLGDSFGRTRQQGGQMTGMLSLISTGFLSLIGTVTGLTGIMASLSAAWATLIGFGGTLAGWLGTLAGLGSGFIAWMAAGSAGALAVAAGIGALIGILAVFVLEMTGVLDAAGDLGAWLGNKLPAMARDGLIALISIVAGPLAVIGAAILGFVRGTLDGGLMEGFRRSWQYIKDIMNVFGGAWKRLINGLIQVGADFITWIGNWSGNFYNKLKSSLSNALTAGQEFGENIVSKITSFGGDMLSAGKGLINEFVDGIKQVADEPVDTVENVVDNVRDFLPFSPAERGPLADLDKVGPGFINEITAGIRDNAGAVKDEIADIAGKAREYLPFSPAERGPLADLDDVGPGFIGQIAGDIRANRDELVGAVEGVTQDGSDAMSLDGATEGSRSVRGRAQAFGKQVKLVIEHQTIEIGDQSLDIRNMSRRELEELAEMISDKQGDQLKELAGV